MAGSRPDELQQALEHHRAGRLETAEQLYRRVLHDAPNDADAWHLLGALLNRLGRHAEAEAAITRAIDLNPNVPEFHSNLGLVYRATRRHEPALACYARALALRPRFPEALHNAGNALSELGRLDEAVESYRKSLKLKPDYAEAHHHLALALMRQRKLTEAARSCRRAVRLDPAYAQAHKDLGRICHAAGEVDEALKCYGAAVRLAPGDASAHNHLGRALRERGKLVEAVLYLKRATQLSPRVARLRIDLAAALREQGKHAEAAECYREALGLEPDCAEAQAGLGNALYALGRYEEAIDALVLAARLKPELAEVQNDMGNAFQAQGKAREAAECYDRAIALRPDYARAHYNRGIVFREADALDEAIASYRRALDLEPDFAEGLNNLAGTLKERALRRDPPDEEELEEALSCYRRALVSKPGDAEIHLNLALASLLAGRFAEGWREYEWRWQTADFVPRHFRQPLWRGESLEGRTILLHAEQGLGDTIHFARYASAVKRAGARVLLLCQRALLRLLKDCPGVDLLIASGDELPEFDVHAPLLSLPGICDAWPESRPAAVPYLRAEPALVERRRVELGGRAGFKVGIAWQGNPDYKRDRFRSIPLSNFEPLARCEGVQLFSLQKGAGTEQLDGLAGRFPVVDLRASLDDLADAAALMASLDLFVSSDTALAHLAGALGRPAWIALSYHPDWRWLLGRADTHWYPTLRLFRQPVPGDWAHVFKQMAARLKMKVEERSASGFVESRPPRPVHEQ